MKRIFGVLLALQLAACGGGSSGGTVTPPDDTGTCSATGQKEFVLGVMRDWYFWNDLLPANVNIDDFATPEQLLDFLTSVQPLDNFSFINSAEADQQFFGEGRFEGYGFSYQQLSGDDVRLARVFVDSPAFRGGLRRGQRFVALNGRPVSDVLANEGLSALFALSPVEFTMRETDGSEFTVQISRDIVTIDPVPQFRIIDAGNGRNVGYLELASFISTANSELDSAFSAFQSAGVTDVILDLRYNGGGLVSTAELLGDLLGGAQDGLIFSETRFNADRASSNNRTEFFERRAASVNLSRLAVIASRGTASASELVINSLDPFSTGGVGVIGDTTFGKPVGQSGFEFCEKILRPTTFETVNSLGEGGYFNGLPLDCAAADDLNIPVGDDADPRVVAALEYLESGNCPTTGAPGGFTKPTATFEAPPIERETTPARVYLDAH